MGTVKKAEVKFDHIPQHAQQAALEVIAYRLTVNGETGDEAMNAVEETKKAFLKLYE